MGSLEFPEWTGLEGGAFTLPTDFQGGEGTGGRGGGGAKEGAVAGEPWLYQLRIQRFGKLLDEHLRVPGGDAPPSPKPCPLRLFHFSLGSCILYSQ